MAKKSIIKWACKSGLSTYSYKIELDVLLSPIYHLVLDLVSGEYKDKPFSEWAVEAFKIEEITGVNSLDEDVTEEDFLIDISRYLNYFLYSKVECLENKGIRLLYKDKGLLIAQSGTKPANCLIQWIKNSGVIEKFLDLVKKEGLSTMKNTLVALMNEQYFGQSVKAIETGILKGTIINKNMLDGFSVEPIDTEAIWLNKEWKQIAEINTDTEYGEVVSPEIEGYGILMGSYILPLETIDQRVKAEAASDYFWLMLNNVFALRSKSASIFRDKCTDFAEALKQSKFALLMKKLQYNLYLRKDGEGIPEEYCGFFEEVYNIEEFKEAANQIFFTGKHVEEQIENKQTMLGLYATQKEKTEFNLRAWINVDTADNQRKTAGNGDSTVNIQTVYALKPQYSYYFCKDYFEDMFAGVLKDCGVDFISNFELSRSDNPANCYVEIDNMVRKQDGTLVYIENKTTMNRYNIEDTLNEVTKFQQIMSDSYPNVKVEYLMVSLYQNDTVEDGYSYFTKAKGQSINDFKIPVARFDGVELHCVVEPEYDKLKEKMELLLR